MSRNLLITMFLFSLISCQSSINKKAEKENINTMLNNWHKAAANAELELFFGSLDETAIYIGTDKHERWTKKEFYEFSKPYFDKGRAWNFVPIERKVYLSENTTDLAWFDETLNSWMGVCRSSGVVQKYDNGWKIKHYHLAVTVPNEQMEDFLRLIDDSTTTDLNK